MNSAISIFTPKQARSNSGFTPYRHTLAYISKQSGNWNRENQVGKLIEACGYKNRAKFFRRREEWNNLRGQVSRAYFKAIGVKIAMLDFTLREDQDEYDIEAARLHFPDHYIMRLVPALYSRVELPGGTTEKEAVEMVRAYHLDGRRPECCIPIPGIKTIWIRKDKSVSISRYRPRMEIKKDFILFSGSNAGIRRSRLR